MYVKRQKGWEKHIDFMLFDILCLGISFYLGYICRHGVSNRAVFGGNNTLYWRLLFVLVAINLCVGFVCESYKSIVRRGYLEELRRTMSHCISVDALALLYLFLVQQTDLYSRETLLVFCVLQVGSTYIVRCFWKHHLRVKMITNPNTEQMLIVTDIAHARQCVAELEQDQYRNYRVVGVVLKDLKQLEDLEQIDRKFLWDARKTARESLGREAYPLTRPVMQNRFQGHGIDQENSIDQENDSDQGNGREDVGEAQALLEVAATVDGNMVPFEEHITYTIGGVPIVAGYRQIDEYLMNHVVDSVFVNASMGQKERRILNNHLVKAGVTVHISLIRMEHDLSNKTVERIGNYMVMTSGMRLATKRQIFLKRCLDICGGLVGAFFAIFAGIIFGPIIFFQSPGPIIFSQTRVGKSGRSFKLYKFRSMYLDAEERKKELMEQNEMNGLMFKMENDPRIIPIGRFIRKYSIDELPQFFNVLKGDMSLVGTRPPTMDEFEQYAPHHRGRLNSKPGITGLWQISGRSDITDFEEVVELDTEYITNWSISEDIRILWKTVKMVVKGNGAK